MKLPVYLAAAIGGIGLLSLLQPIEEVLMKLVPMPRFLESTFETIGNPNDFLGSILLAVLVAPAVEEILFRGLILQGFVRNYGTVHGLMLSSLLFGIVHLNPYQFVAGFILGLFIGLLFIKTGSILPGLLVHGFYNGALIGANSVLQATMNQIANDGVVAAVELFMGAVLTGFGLLLLLRATRQLPRRASVHSTE